MDRRPDLVAARGGLGPEDHRLLAEFGLDVPPAGGVGPDAG
jgi:hypothetical protein